MPLLVIADPLANGFTMEKFRGRSVLALPDPMNTRFWQAVCPYCGVENEFEFTQVNRDFHKRVIVMCTHYYESEPTGANIWTHFRERVK